MRIKPFISAAALIGFCTAPALSAQTAAGTAQSAPQTTAAPQAPAPSASPAPAGQAPTASTSPAPAGQTASPGPASGATQPMAQGSTPVAGGSAGATSGAQPGAGGTSSIADTEHGTSILLLDRIQKILDKAIDGKGSEVTIERGLVDEIRAELAQVKSSLQAEKR